MVNPGSRRSVRAAFASVLLLAASAAQAGAPLATATGKVPLEGSLSTSYATPAEGSVVYLYFAVTPLLDVPSLKVRLDLPEGAAAIADARLEREFHDVGAGQTVHLVVPVEVVVSGELPITGSASVAEGERLVQSRAFVLVLNPAGSARSEGVAGESGEGEPLVIYGDPAPSSPPR